MKKTFLAITAMLGLVLTGCGNSSNENQSAQKDNASTQTVLSVDDVLENAASLVGKTVAVEGECSHLCKHGGVKAFLVSAKSDQSLRAEAKGEFKAFPKETIHQVLRITGVVVEDRIDEAAVKKMEEEYGKLEQVHGENVEVGCDAEKAAQGQEGIDTFAARMQDYRDKIAERQAKEGKAYLSFYHIDASGYEIVKDE